MTKIIAIANRKGGTGKTTVAIAIATKLAETRRVLLIDLDSQANATEGLNVPLRPAVAQWLIMETKPELHVCHNLVLLPGNAKTERANGVLAAEADYAAISRNITRWLPGYDYILLDCPPSLSMLTKAAIYAADYVLAPTTAEYWGVAGIRQLSQLIAQVREKFRRPVQLMGIQPNKYDRRTKEHFSHLTNLIGVYGAYTKNGAVWPPLRQSISVAQSAAEGKPLWDIISGKIQAEWAAMVERVVSYE